MMKAAADACGLSMKTPLAARNHRRPAGRSSDGRM
jgi:hypothetical protein